MFTSPWLKSLSLAPAGREAQTWHGRPAHASQGRLAPGLRRKLSPSTRRGCYGPLGLSEPRHPCTRGCAPHGVPAWKKPRRITNALSVKQLRHFTPYRTVQKRTVAAHPVPPGANCRPFHGDSAPSWFGDCPAVWDCPQFLLPLSGNAAGRPDAQDVSLLLPNRPIPGHPARTWNPDEPFLYEVFKRPVPCASARTAPPLLGVEIRASGRFGPKNPSETLVTPCGIGSELSASHYTLVSSKTRSLTTRFAPLAHLHISEVCHPQTYSLGGAAAP
jgi:hypothetical protein